MPLPAVIAGVTAALSFFQGIAEQLDRFSGPGSHIRNLRIDPQGHVQFRLNVRDPRVRSLGGYDAAHARVQRELEALFQRGTQPSADVLRLLNGPAVDVIQNWLLTAPPLDEPGYTDEPQRESQVYGGLQLTPVGTEDFFVPRFVAGRHSSIPGGTAGMRQQTDAALTSIGYAGRSSNPRRATRRPRPAAMARRATARRAPKRSKGAHLVAGTTAAKRHMAKLRAMQKRKRR